MRASLLALGVLGLSACGTFSSAPPAAGPADASISEGADAAAPRTPQQPVLNTEVLPSLDRTGTVKADAALLQRPKVGSVVLAPLSAGVSIKVLGTLDNADGQWLSVSLNDLQGWVRAAEIAHNP